MRRSRAGLAIALTLIVLTMVVVLGFGLATLGVQNLAFADAERYSKMALTAGEGGVNQAIVRLKVTPSFEAQFDYNLLTETAQVNVTNNATGGASPKTAPNGQLVYPGNVYILATGSAKAGAYRRQVGVMLHTSSTPLFSMAAFGDTGVTFSSNVATDSYRSADGAYNVTLPSGGSNLKSNGDVGSNGNLAVTSGAVIKGDVRVGGSVSGGPSVTGTVTTAASAITLPVVDCTYQSDNQNATGLTGSSGSFSYNASTKDLTISGERTINLAPGKYYFRNIICGSSATINISGKTEIYLTGTANFGSGTRLNNSTKIPANMQFFSSNTTAGGDGAFKLTSNSDFYGTIFAPKGKVELDSGVKVYGAVVGKSLNFDSNTRLHYDESLNAASGITYVIGSWQRF